jgi:hypothetical protein
VVTTRNNHTHKNKFVSVDVSYIVSRDALLLCAGTLTIGYLVPVMGFQHRVQQQFDSGF